MWYLIVSIPDLCTLTYFVVVLFSDHTHLLFLFSLMAEIACLYIVTVIKLAAWVIMGYQRPSMREI